MEYKIIGIEHVNYVNKQNKKVIGLKLYLVFNSDSIKGTGCLPVYIGEKRGNAYETACLLNLDDNIELYYDRFGNVVSVGKL